MTLETAVHAVGIIVVVIGGASAGIAITAFVAAWSLERFLKSVNIVRLIVDYAWNRKAYRRWKTENPNAHMRLPRAADAGTNGENASASMR